MPHSTPSPAARSIANRIDRVRAGRSVWAHVDNNADLLRRIDRVKRGQPAGLTVAQAAALQQQAEQE